jgi:hypothetical protein
MFNKSHNMIMGSHVAAREALDNTFSFTLASSIFKLLSDMLKRLIILWHPGNTISGKAFCGPNML